MLDLPLDWNAMTAAGATVGSGAIVVCDDRACMLDMALNSMRFFRNESCGKCVPCRTGSQKMVDMLTDVDEGHGRAARLAPLRGALPGAAADVDLRARAGRARADRLGHEAFPDEVDAHLAAASVRPASASGWGDRVSESITLTIDGRDDHGAGGHDDFDAARMNGIPIPTLCHQQNQTPVGVCRVCVVDVGARVLPRPRASASASRT